MPLDLRRERDLGRILDDAFALYRAHWRTFVLIAVLVVVPVDLVVLGGALGWLWEGYHGRGSTLDTVIPVVTQYLVISPLVIAMSMRVLIAVGEGHRPGVGAAMRAGLSVFVPLVVTTVLVGLGVASGIVLFIVPGVILWVLWSMASQVVVAEGLSGPAALRRSQGLVQGSGWWTFTVVLVVNLMSSVFGVVVELPLQAAAKAADAQALILVGDLLAPVVTFPLVAIALGLAYFTLHSRELGRLPEGEAGWARRRAEGWQPPA